MQNEKDNHIFYYRYPICRVPIMTFGWRAVWDKDLYGNEFDLDIHGKAEPIKENLLKIVDAMPRQVEESYENVRADENSQYKRTLEEVTEAINKSGGFTAKSIDELLASFANNNQTPPHLRDVLKEHLEHQQ